MSFEILADQEKCQWLIDVFMIFLIFLHLEDNSPTFRVFRVFPFGLDVPLEDIDGVDLLPLIVDLEPR